MRPTRIIAALGSILLLAGQSSESGGEAFSCPWGPVSIGTVEGERLRQLGISESAYRIQKCRSLMPEAERRRLCDIGLLTDCPRPATEIVGESVRGSVKERPKLKGGAPRRRDLPVLFVETDVRFREADANGDNRVSPPEAIEHFRFTCLGRLADIAVSDRDGDGFLDGNEWSSLLMSPGSCSVPSGTAQSNVQLRAILTRMNDASAETRRHHFRNADRNEDGCVGSAEAAAALRLATTSMDVAGRFRRADANGDDCLTEGEWNSLLTTIVVGR